MMRAASALMVAVLLTTSTISGTFAKYVTEASGKDEARVAQWGVEVSSIASELFAKSYARDSATEIANTVEATEKLVAPGTTHKDGGVKFVLRGTPEVAAKVEIKITNSAKTGEPIEVKLPAGTYKDYTKAIGVNADGTAIYDETLILGSDYYPVKFYLEDNGATVVEGTLAEIKTYILDKLEIDAVPGDGKPGEYAPGTNLAEILGGTTGVYTLTWEWIFESGNDEADTFLGNAISGAISGAFTDAKFADAVTDIDFAIEIVVTQID